jgi:porphyrinogen peroxidase
VDGTENPTGTESSAATIVGDDDVAFAGGSYVMVQKYLHDHAAWHDLPTETQEGIIGRTKLDDIELDDDHKPAFAHNALTTLIENGFEVKILRHNMPFGRVTSGDSGTYFIGYARSLHPL